MWWNVERVLRFEYVQQRCPPVDRPPSDEVRGHQHFLCSVCFSCSLRYTVCTRRMVVRLRLARFGRKHLPTYRVVVADQRAPRDGRHIEQVCGALLAYFDLEYL